MSPPPCDRPSCHNRAAYRITSGNLPTPLRVCDHDLAWGQKTAGVPRETEAIADDGQDALFDMPEPKTRRGNLR